MILENIILFIIINNNDRGQDNECIDCVCVCV